MEWRKTIPESRDRFQSKLLVWTVGSLLVLSLFWMVYGLAINLANLFLSHVKDEALPSQLIAFGVSLTFALIVWALRSATPAAAFFGGIICLGLMLFQQVSFLLPLMTLFALTFLATRAGRTRKQASGLAEGKRGRSASQVLANLGAAPFLLLVCLCYRYGHFFFVWTMVTAALVEATADTVSSEIGQAFGGRPILISTFKRVAPGTDGAISLLGTAAGIAAGALVASAAFYSIAYKLLNAEIALAAGIAGLFFDSILGATVERKGWLGNDWVNFLSTLFAAFAVLLIFRLIGQPLEPVNRMARGLYAI